MATENWSSSPMISIGDSTFRTLFNVSGGSEFCVIVASDIFNNTSSAIAEWGTHWKDGDLNNDDKVNILDIVVVALAYGSLPGGFKWNFIADTNNDGAVNILDIVKVAINFGRLWT
jgi:hypothetical protein